MLIVKARGRESGTMKHAAFLIAALLLSACQPTYTLELYDGPQREDEHVATIVTLRWECFNCVFSIRLTGKQNNIYTYPTKEDPFDTPAIPVKFRLPPGRYEVSIAATLGKTAGAYWVGEVDLEPGHTYRVKSERCVLFCWGRYYVLNQTWVWMEEAVTDEVLLGFRIPRDETEGAKWFRFAAQRGDDDNAGYWYQGDARYQDRLGDIYERGRGVPQNHVLAYMWYSIASSNGESAAAYHRDRVGEKMTPDQIAEAQRLAKEWKPK